jgi:MFS family permease
VSPLAYPAFRRLFFSRCISLLGTGLSTIGLAFLAYHLSGAHGGVVVGIALAIKMVAYITMAPVITHFSRHIPRKLFLISMDLIRCVLILMVPLVSRVSEIYWLIFFISACSAGFSPIYQSMIPELVPLEKTYAKALILTRVAYNVEVLLSPALSALLLLAFNFHILFFINSLTFLLSAMLIIMTTLPARQKMQGEKPAHILAGISQYLANPQLLACLCLVLVSSIAGATVIVNTVVFFHGLLQQSRSLAAMAMMCFGMGSVGLALFMPMLKERVGQHKMMRLGAAVVAFTFLFAMFLHAWPVLLLVWLVLGAACIAIESLLGVLVNQFATEKTRPALFAANFSLTHACWLIAYLLTGFVGAERSLSVYFGVLFAVVVLLLVFARFVIGARLTKIV